MDCCLDDLLNRIDWRNPGEAVDTPVAVTTGSTALELEAVAAADSELIPGVVIDIKKKDIRSPRAST
ncbi:hypothetical protein NQ318_004371 [Aromia moschata]|uniref:Uncharacterized protein n=1 Tax=Aromia moschata TaxID=1265417 RepID=A0AAV8YRM7_9CUCU|nr:hypothetical protein NQ318_004371 [Aromia moschata]